MVVPFDNTAINLDFNEHNIQTSSGIMSKGISKKIYIFNAAHICSKIWFRSKSLQSSVNNNCWSQSQFLFQKQYTITVQTQLAITQSYIAREKFTLQVYLFQYRIQSLL